MKERGIIFNGEMVRATLSGQKTQTRRIVTPQPDEDGLARLRGGPWMDTSERVYRCPFGEVGNRLYVRETWAEAGASAPELKLYRANYPEHVPPHYENVPAVEDIRWTPSIHMPRHASRILLEITDVRVERLNDISEEDAIAEGIASLDDNYGNGPAYCDYLLPNLNDTAEWYVRASCSFRSLWKSIYGSESWNSNPWCWAITFKRIEGD